jgi:hypothetical protein
MGASPRWSGSMAKSLVFHVTQTSVSQCRLAAQCDRAEVNRRMCGADPWELWRYCVEVFVQGDSLISQNWAERFPFSHGFITNTDYPREQQRMTRMLQSISPCMHHPRIAVRFHRQNAFRLPKEILHHYVISKNVKLIADRLNHGKHPNPGIGRWPVRFNSISSS